VLHRWRAARLRVLALPSAEGGTRSYANLLGEAPAAGVHASHVCSLPCRLEWTLLRCRQQPAQAHATESACQSVCYHVDKVRSAQADMLAEDAVMHKLNR